MNALRTSLTVVAGLAFLTACNRQPATPQPAPGPAQPTAPQAPPAPPVGYACESGKTVTVQYPDTSTATLTYNNQTYTLRTVQAASGARYAGSGMEWWTATRDGQESATLSRLGPNQDVGVAVLERCSRPSAGVDNPTGPTAPVTPAPGGMMPASAPCRALTLKLAAEDGDAGMGNRVQNFSLQNTGAQACSLTGYPTVTLRDAQGRGLTAVRAEQSPGSYFRQGQAPSPVEIQPQGKAFFEVAWNVVPHEGEGERVCPVAARVFAAVPGDPSPLSLPFQFTPCGSKVHVSPIRSADAQMPTG